MAEVGAAVLAQSRIFAKPTHDPLRDEATRMNCHLLQ